MNRNANDSIDDSTRGRTGRRWLCVAAMAVAFVLFAGAIGAGFVWDDELLFRSWLPYLDGPAAILSPPGDIPHFPFQYFRPLVLASYVADETLAAAVSAAEDREQARRIFFHLTPVLLHVACTGLLFLLGRRLLLRSAVAENAATWKAFAAALLFAAHPIHVETAAWIAGRSDSLCTLLGLGSLLTFLDWRARRRRSSLLATGLLLLLALLGKESALGLLLPGLLIATAWPGGEGQRARGGHHAAEVACLVTTLALYGGLRLAYGNDGATLSSLSISASAFPRAGAALGWYLTKLLWPFPQAVFPPDRLGAPFVAVGLVAAALVGAGFLAWRRRGRRAERVALAITVGGIVVPLAVSLAPVATSPVAERHLYLPSAGACLLFAFLLARATAGRTPIGRSRLPPVVLLAGVLAVPAGLASSIALRAWESPLAFWTAASRSAPESPVAFINLGKSLASARRFDEAALAYSHAASLARTPDQVAMAHINLGSLHLLAGRPDAAIDELALALTADPHDATARFNWASALVTKSRRERNPVRRRELVDEAVLHLRSALERHPRYAKAHLLLGSILLARGEPEAARERLEAAVEIAPSSSAAHRARELLASFPAVR